MEQTGALVLQAPQNDYKIFVGEKTSLTSFNFLIFQKLIISCQRFEYRNNKNKDLDRKKVLTVSLKVCLAVKVTNKQPEFMPSLVRIKIITIVPFFQHFTCWILLSNIIIILSSSNWRDFKHVILTFSCHFECFFFLCVTTCICSPPLIGEWNIRWIFFLFLYKL